MQPDMCQINIIGDKYSAQARFEQTTGIPSTFISDSMDIEV
jgi:hypothetical protein